mgnify:CR=1 FL=1
MATTAVFSGLSAILSIIISGFLLKSYLKSRNASLLAWALGLASYSVSHFLDAAFDLSIKGLELSPLLVNYFRGLTVMFFLAAVYYGIAIRLTDKKFLTTYLPLSTLALHALIFYFGATVLDVALARSLVISLITLPMSLAIGLMFISLERIRGLKGGLLVGAAWLAYAALLPLYLLLLGKPEIIYFFAARSLVSVLLFIGFIMLLKNDYWTQPKRIGTKSPAGKAAGKRRPKSAGKMR